MTTILAFIKMHRVPPGIVYFTYLIYCAVVIGLTLLPNVRKYEHITIG